MVNRSPLYLADVLDTASYLSCFRINFSSSETNTISHHLALHFCQYDILTVNEHVGGNNTQGVKRRNQAELWSL